MTTVNKTPTRRDPIKSKGRILRAAVDEFATKGLQGARVDEIARRAGANKRMLYHYFGNKEALFLEALEFAYEEIRKAELDLHLADLPPIEAMERLVSFTFNYFIEAPHFITLLNSENLHRARHLKRSGRILDMHSTVVEMLRELLLRGEGEGVFRRDVDPVQLFITIASVGYFYFSNIHTLSTIFDRDFASAPELRTRHDHAVEVVLGYLRP
jgi:AcrR family transcriptional regulator